MPKRDIHPTAEKSLHRLRRDAAILDHREHAKFEAYVWCGLMKRVSVAMMEAARNHGRGCSR
jgi:hypothetical protein